MASKQATARLRKELKAINNDPPPYISVSCDDSNILVWHYLLEGPPDTPYDGGWYWGRVRFPPNYPFAPPSILMLTPSGRFETKTRLCLSMSDYHPENWQPAWSLATVLKGLLSFMCEETMTTGALDPPAPLAEKRRLAACSAAWNRSQPDFERAFPEFGSLVEAAAARRGPVPQARGDVPVHGGPPSQPTGGFLPGDVVRLRGLKAKPELNGRDGVVEAREVAPGRVAIRLGEEAEGGDPVTLAVLPANLERPPAGEAEEEGKEARAVAAEPDAATAVGAGEDQAK